MFRRREKCFKCNYTSVHTVRVQHVTKQFVRLLYTHVVCIVKILRWARIPDKPICLPLLVPDIDDSSCYGANGKLT